MPSFPSFMAPLEAGAPAPGVAGAPEQAKLDALVMSGQEEVNWCWAAVTQAVLKFRHGREISQEDIASDHARRTGKKYLCAAPHRRKVLGGACGDGSCTGSCNDNHLLRIVLAEQGCLRDVLTAKAAPSFDAVRAEIDSGRPLACRVQWQPTGGHFILVSGWSIGADRARRVHVLDPASNQGGKTIAERILPYDTFASGYTQSGLRGRINYSYRTS